MLDQTFTTDNFRKIYDQENRRGVNLEGRFFPELQLLTEDIRQKTIDIKGIRSKPEFPTPELIDQVEKLKANRSSLQANKNREIDGILDALSAKIREKGFSMTLLEADGPGEKKVYPLEDTPENFFVSKQLQRNLNRLYGIKQSNRHTIVQQLKAILSDSLPKVLVRTDIATFYETIDRSRLLQKLSSDQLLSLSSKAFIKQILKAYGEATGEEKGLPRGVGVSAYLSELFMRTIDRALSSMSCVIFYARYVDDIVIVFAPSAADDMSDCMLNITKIISNEGLAQNEAKTGSYPLGPGLNASFDYLGYTFAISDATCHTKISAAKVARYKARLKLCFDRYASEARLNKRVAHRRLVSRVRFLTGNTQLLNSKQHAMTGIYFSNSALTDPTALVGLDAYLNYLTGTLASPRLEARLGDLSFKRGFDERTFHHFSSREMGMIVSAWKHGA